MTGSDAAETSYLHELREAGIEPAIGHAAEHVPATSAEVIFSTAVPEDNPERAEARRRGLASSTAATCSAAGRAAARDRRRRHARQDHDDEHDRPRPARCGGTPAT